MLSTGIIAAFVCVILFSLGDTLAKNAATALGSYRTALYIVVSGGVPIAVAFALFPPQSITVTILELSCLGGVFLAAGYALVYISLRTEQASDTWALINISPAALILFGIFVLGEPVNPLQAVCIGAIIIGALMITVTEDVRFNRKLLPAMAGNLCFAAFILIAVYGMSTYRNDITAFYFVPRLVAIAALVGYAAVKPKSLRAAAGTKRSLRLWGISQRRIAVVSGLLDGAAQASFMLVVLFSVVAIGSAITAAEPVLVVLLCYVLYRERLTRLQAAGIVISVIGAVAVGFV